MDKACRAPSTTVVNDSIFKGSSEHCFKHFKLLFLAHRGIPNQPKLFTSLCRTSVSVVVQSCQIPISSSVQLRSSRNLGCSSLKLEEHMVHEANVFSRSTRKVLGLGFVWFVAFGLGISHSHSLSLSLSTHTHTDIFFTIAKASLRLCCISKASQLLQGFRLRGSAGSVSN